MQRKGTATLMVDFTALTVKPTFELKANGYG